MSIHAIVRHSDNKVVNITEWDGIAQHEFTDENGTRLVGWNPPAGTFAVESTVAKIGQVYNVLNGTFADA